MDFRVFAAQLLRHKRHMNASVLNLTDEIALLEESKTSVASLVGSPLSSTGTNRYEDRLVNLICLCDELRQRRKTLRANLECIERGMKKLTDYERCLLDSFYVFCEKSAAESMMSRFHKERSTIYRDKDKALEHFTKALYGTTGNSTGHNENAQLQKNAKCKTKNAQKNAQCKMKDAQLRTKASLRSVFSNSV